MGGDTVLVLFVVLFLRQLVALCSYVNKEVLFIEYLKKYKKCCIKLLIIWEEDVKFSGKYYLLLVIILSTVVLLWINNKLLNIK